QTSSGRAWLRMRWWADQWGLDRPSQADEGDHLVAAGIRVRDRQCLPVVSDPDVPGRVDLDACVAHQPVEAESACRGDGLPGRHARWTVGGVGAAELRQAAAV